MPFFREHQREMVAAVVGACVAGVFSLAVGLYSLTRGFEYTQNKEQLKSLRQDIEFLTRVRSEIDANAQALINKDHTARAKFSTVPSMMDFMQAAKKLENSKKKPTPDEEALLKQLRRTFGQENFVLEDFYFPRIPLVSDSWKTSYPEAGDIPFDLLNEINEYYRRVRNANSLIDRLEGVSQGIGVASGYRKVIEEDIAYFNSQVDELKRLDAIKLKNKISAAILSLSERRKRLATTLEKEA